MSTRAFTWSGPCRYDHIPSVFPSVFCIKCSQGYTLARSSKKQQITQFHSQERNLSHHCHYRRFGTRILPCIPKCIQKCLSVRRSEITRSALECLSLSTAESAIFSTSLLQSLTAVSQIAPDSSESRINAGQRTPSTRPADQESNHKSQR